MTHDEKMKALERIFNRCLEVADAKGRDYSGTIDGMGNFRDFGWRGIVVRIGDKYHRAKNLTNSQALPVVAGEKVEDTLMDMLVYSALALVQKEIEDADVTLTGR